MLKSAIAVFAAFIAMSQAASAEIISLPALGFVRYDPIGTTQDPAPDNGSLTPVLGVTLYAGVEFPVDGNSVCRLSLFYGDTNPSEIISAKLFRKKITTGGAVNAAPQLMATVRSGVTVTGMRKVSTATISNALINEVGYFYYVEVLAQNFNTPLVGVQVEHKTSCP